MDHLTLEPRQAAKPAATAPTVGRRWSDGIGNISASSDPNAPWSMTQHWPALVATLSEQAVESSNLVLRALEFLVGAGRLRRTEAKALSDALYQLRDTSLRAQQITRLASGRIRQAKDRVDLADVIRQLIDERANEFAEHGAEVHAVLAPTDVLLDPPAAVSLVNTIIDWGLSFSREVHLTLEAPEMPGPARLVVRVATPPGAHGQPGSTSWQARPRGRRLNDGLHWMLLRQMAASAHIKVTRLSEPGVALVAIEFPKTFLNAEGIATMELLDAESSMAQLEDGWVLVVVRDPVLRRAALEALRSVSVEAQGAADFNEARGCILSGKPQALVVGFDSVGTQLHEFRADALGHDWKCPVVEITQESPSFHVNGFEGFETAKVGREDVSKELAPAVLFELVKHA
ncbi:hypothetical protein [Ramlibacter albus]|uniref:Uncharacterized protein n=1 Tax=Ramlibacter albus TaxID=2079448 RepID=A0A923M6I5_9BURK|nr:hypothetical protein [Ramlibacter albus]MBC5765147.1 hypothetical protein [Ramlibacter albus]